MNQRGEEKQGSWLCRFVSSLRSLVALQTGLAELAPARLPSDVGVPLFSAEEGDCRP